MDSARVDEIIDRYYGEASALIQVLLQIQSEHHWLPKETLKRVSEKLGVPLTRIQHIATFYKAFSLVGECCALCKECAYPEECRFPQEKRPSVESFSIDVIGTLKKLGTTSRVATNTADSFNYYGIMLLE